jgi:tetratricopeptide (TPR) repeat protein
VFGSEGFIWSVERTQHELREIIGEIESNGELSSVLLALSHLASIKFDLERARSYAVQAVLADPHGIVALRRAGEATLAVADLDSAIMYFENRHVILTADNGDDGLIAESFIDLATAHYELCNYGTAQQLLTKCLKLFDSHRVKDNRLKALLFNNLGANICASLPSGTRSLKAAEAVEYLPQAIALSEIEDTDLHKAYSRNNLAEVYRKTN